MQISASKASRGSRGRYRLGMRSRMFSSTQKMAMSIARFQSTASPGPSARGRRDRSTDMPSRRGRLLQFWSTCPQYAPDFGEIQAL